MSATTNARPQTAPATMPEVPLTVEGYSVLHQMMRFRWPAWRALSQSERAAVLEEAQTVLQQMESQQTALFSLLGHKGDLLFLHFRNSFDEVNAAELKLSQLRLADYLEPLTSYVSVIELGLYESTVKTYEQLMERGLEPHSDDWKKAIKEVIERQREAMRPRLYPDIPNARYLCFYPMDRRRGEEKNWYTLPIRERQRQMHEHGMVGRRYAGEVKQIITGSIGFDDWEWGVDLFADNPLVFKKLIYEMRFDAASAAYALFGTFYVGLRLRAADLGTLLSGTTPAFWPTVG